MSQPDESTGELAEPTPPPADHEQTNEPVTEPAQETDHSHTKEGGDKKEEHREEEHKPQENGDFNAATKASDSQPLPEAVREVKFEDDHAWKESKADSVARDGPSSGRRRVSNDKDAQAMVIDSLRSQVQDLISQVTALNGKLVKSYDRVSDLEDALHVSDSNLRSTTLKISQLELERTQHLSALDTGLLVEKAQVTSELTRLMEKATDEAARRGQAESARHEIEQELDDLSAGLFDQANTMVAEARFARARSERKAEDTERALKETEEVVGLMQKQMQALQEEKEEAERRTEEMNIKMGKGKWVERTLSPGSGDALHLLSSHQPYHEFMMFVAHLRSLRPNSSQVPAMSTLLPLPFLSRLLSEDTDPTVRLDLAPSLNWLTRRSVISAIHNGQLSIEPIPAHALLEATHPSLPVPIPVSNNQSGISCALCGTSIFPPGSSNPGSPTRPGHSLSRTASGTAWPSTLFKNPLSSNLGSAPPSPPPYQGAHPPPTQIYIFRLAVQTNSALPVPIPNSPQARSQTTMYPLCTSGWCLTRLRTTCSLWAFVRTGIVERVWDEASAQVLPPSRKDMPSIPAPPVPPRRKSKMSGLWSALGGWSENDKEKEKEKEKEAIKAEAYLLTRRGTVHEVKAPPPLRHKEVLPPPPLHPTVAKTEKSAAVPPPLPKRSVSRQHPVPPAEPHVNGMEAPAPPSVNGDSVNGDSVNGASINGDSVNGHDGKLSVESETRSVSSITAPDESEVHSKDAFLTPTEQPSSPVSAPRSGSPSTIPLPDSGRSTPDFSEPSNEDEPVAAEPTTESSLQPEESTNAEHAEPATEPTTAVNTLTNQENAPSRTGSPAPPPLPRRAPARNRPVPPPPPPRAPGHHGTTADSTPEPVTTDSMPTPEPVSSISPSPDPAAPTSKSSPELAADGAAPAEKENEETPANGPAEPPADDKTETVQASADDATSDHKSVEDADEDAQHANGISIQPPTPAADDADDAASTAAVNETTPPATPELLPPPATSEFPPPPKRAVPPALPPRRSLDRTSSLRSSSDSQSQSQKQLNGADGEPYVGDATWEERTWKEVVRLREDMFWARVGGVR